MYTSRKARLYSLNFHSPRKPSVPMPKERIGGTVGACAKRAEARRIVPSPPSVEIRSVLCERRVGAPSWAVSLVVNIGNGS